MALLDKTLVAAVLLCGATETASANPTCLSRDLIVDRLGENYSERLIGRGLQGTARMFEVFMSRDGSSWTILQTFPSGMSCIMAAGTDWHHDDIAQVFGVEG